MQATLERLKAIDSLDTIHAALVQHGAVLVEDFLGSDILTAIRSEVEGPIGAADPGMKHMNPAIQWFFGKETKASFKGQMPGCRGDFSM